LEEVGNVVWFVVKDGRIIVFVNIPLKIFWNLKRKLKKMVIWELRNFLAQKQQIYLRILTINTIFLH